MTLFILILSLLTTMMVSNVVNAGDNQQQAVFTTPKLVVNASFLNVRTGPGTRYSVLTTAVGGMELPVLGVARDLTWYQVATNAGVGWVNVEFALARGDFTAVPFVEAAPPLVIQPQVVIVNPGQGGGFAPPSSGGQVVSNSPTGRLTGISLTGGDLREGPGETANIAPGLSADDNTVYAVTNAVNLKGEVWYQITVPGFGTGWVSKARERPVACNSGDFIVTMNIQNSGVAIGSEGYVVGVRGDFFTLMFSDGSTRTVAAAATTARSENVKSVCPGGVSVSLGQLGQGGAVPPPTMPTFTVPLQAPSHLIVNTGQLNVRSGPGANFTVIARVTGGTDLSIAGTAPDNEWFLVVGYFGQGWVDSEFTLFRGDFSTVPVIRDAYSIAALNIQPVIVNPGQGGGVPVPVLANPVISTTNRVVVNTGNLNIRSGPSGGFGIVTAVPGGTELPVLGRTRDSAWFLVQGGFGQGWVSVEFVVFRGDFNSVPVIG